jgi:hypothetical protein
MHKNATKCNETLRKWCKNKHGASKIMDTLETYHDSFRIQTSRAAEEKVFGLEVQQPDGVRYVEYPLTHWQNMGAEPGRREVERWHIGERRGELF